MCKIIRQRNGQADIQFPLVGKAMALLQASTSANNIQQQLNEVAVVLASRHPSGVFPEPSKGCYIYVMPRNSSLTYRKPNQIIVSVQAHLAIRFVSLNLVRCEWKPSPSILSWKTPQEHPRPT